MSRPLIALLAGASLAAFAGLAATSAAAEEGMWTFDNFPISRANATLGTAIDQAWLDRVRLASVRLAGCSAGFVSGEGLVLTNQHCVASCVAALSTSQTNYASTGFLPRTREEELKCPGQVAEVLTAITDVTEPMQTAGAGLSGQAFTQARDAEAARIEQEACAGDTTRRCQVISLYRGGQFKLYDFRRYEDVRLAWAPEDRASTFGGDLDNFSFPRFAIDAALLRVYENGVPAQTPNFFRWNPRAPEAGSPVFLTGNPGSTQRLLTQDQLMTLRDVVLPLDQLMDSELRGRLIRFADESADNAFMAMDPLYSLENTYKRGRGRMAALIDTAFMGRRAEAEADFRSRVAVDASLAVEVGDPWAALAAVQPVQRELYPAYALLEARAGGGSLLFNYARTLVRAAQEREKPSAERLPEFSDSRLGAARNALLARRPVYPTLEQERLEWWLSKTREWLTVDDPRVRALLGRDSPEGLSAQLVEGSTLGDPAVRQALWEGGMEAIRASTDPMIRYALAIQEPTRAIRADWEARVQAPTDRASEALARARFAVYGDRVYPDATFTLRLTYGLIEGSDVPGQRFGPFTTFGGLWDRATGAAPFDVAPRILAARDRIDPTAVVNMTASTDTIGGSSGSPAINAAGEVIGANFDSTVLTQRNAYGYDRNVNRSVLVSTEAITAALGEVYEMDHLLRELGVE
ncbi:MAG: S46 family peptidase [Brevundimonas sp.]|uniref:S46 family peptidase n=1 Tax=Brevundimonas sp. TaxID=1871086 RepID=UPI00391B6542